jgi:hypothetical protein
MRNTWRALSPTRRQLVAISCMAAAVARPCSTIRACFGPLLDRFRLGIQLGGDPAHIIAALGDRALGLGFGHFRVHFAACAKSVVPQGAGRRMHCL